MLGSLRTFPRHTFRLADLIKFLQALNRIAPWQSFDFFGAIIGFQGLSTGEKT
jgi:hypothetical protein